MITLLFWSALGLILYTYLAYPVLMYLVALCRPSPWVQQPMFPRVSIIMAVRNGAALIQEKIQNLLDLEYPSELFELLIVSDGSTDATGEIVERARNTRIRTWVFEKHQGKAWALNQAIAHATGEILLFVDIRPQVEKQAMAKLMRNFSDPKVGAVAGELFLSSGEGDESTKAIGGLYWRYEQWIRTCEVMVDSAVGVYGGFYAIRRVLATKLPPGTILDDMFQPLNIIRQGYRSVLDREARVWDTWPATSSGEFSRKVRTLAGNFQLLQIAPWLLSGENRVRFQLISHKLVRLLVPLALTVSLGSAMLLARPFYATIAGIEAAFLVLGLLGWKFKLPRLLGLSGLASGFVLLNVAVVVGLYRYVTEGDQLWRIWVNPGSTRSTRLL
jgi:cellulose synthase/poly-beta-1,6-N-acetylglucosamine synthase-like glycosyltransferase